MTIFSEANIAENGYWYGASNRYVKTYVTFGRSKNNGWNKKGCWLWGSPLGQLQWSHSGKYKHKREHSELQSNHSLVPIKWNLQTTKKVPA